MLFWMFTGVQLGLKAGENKAVLGEIQLYPPTITWGLRSGFLCSTAANTTQPQISSQNWMDECFYKICFSPACCWCNSTVWFKYSVKITISCFPCKLHIGLELSMPSNRSLKGTGFREKWIVSLFSPWLSWSSSHKQWHAEIGCNYHIYAFISFIALVDPIPKQKPAYVQK